MSHLCKNHGIVYDDECPKCVTEQRDTLLEACGVALDEIIDGNIPVATRILKLAIAKVEEDNHD